MRKTYLFDLSSPSLKGDTPAHRKASAAAVACDEWMGATVKPKGETRVVVPLAALALLEGLFFEQIDFMRAKGWEVKIFRKEWGAVPKIEVLAVCGARLVVAA